MERKLGNIFGFQGGNYAGNVYDKDFECQTLNTMQGGCKQPMIVEANSIRMVRTEQGKALRKQYENHEIHHGFNEFREPELRKDEVTNTLSTVQKDNYICVAMRGRNPTNPSDRTPGIETEQRLEPNMHGTCNTLTSVQKDNLVLENKGISTKGKEIDIASTVLAGYERTNMTGFNADNAVMETVRIKQATKDGFIECKVGGVADLSYPNSNTRRGRVQDNGNTCPTLTAENQDICRIEKEVINPLKDLSENGWHFEQNVYDSGGLVRSIKSESGSGNIPKVIEQYRIRKLTPRECWRLMDFSDEDFEKAAEVNSNTQLYKQAGNSIIRNVLVAILGQLIEGKEDAYRKV